MRTRVWIWACAILVLVVGCGGGGSQGLLVHLVYDDEGRTEPELIVRDAQGEELRRIEIEGTLLGQVPLAGGHRVSAFDLEARQYIVDAAQGTIVEIESPGDDAQVGRIETGQVVGGGKRWAILDSAENDVGYLVDLVTGELQDLQGIEPDSRLAWAQFSPDETNLLVSDIRWTWILPTEDPEDVRRLGEGERSSFPAFFSRDGRQVLYVLGTEDGGKELLLESVDGSKVEVLVEDDDLRTAWFVPGRDELLVMYNESLTILSLRSGAEEAILDFDGPSYGTPRFGPGDKVLLFVAESLEDYRWYHLDVKQRKAERLRDLDDLVNAVPSPWLPETALTVVMDTSAYSMEPVTARFTAVNVATGKTQEELELDDVRQWMVLSVTDDAEHLLLQVRRGDEFELWLFSAGAEEPEKLADGDYVTGAISPDKRWIAVSVEEGSGPNREAKLELIEIKSRKTLDLGEGARPIWARP